jgi:hypothetical protein
MYAKSPKHVPSAAQGWKHGLVCYRQPRITSGLRRLARNDDKFSEERRARPIGEEAHVTGILSYPYEPRFRKSTIRRA